MFAEAREIAEEVSVVLSNQGEVAECASVGVGVTPVVDEAVQENFYCQT